MGTGLMPEFGLQVSNLLAPAGTRLPFNNAAAPLGWVTDATLSDHVLWVAAGSGGVNGTGGGASGLSAFFNGAWSTDGHSLTIAELAAHSHTDSGHTHTDAGHSHGQNSNTWYNLPGFTFITGGGGNITNLAANTGTASAAIQTSTANIQNTGSGTAHPHTVSTKWQYAGHIVAQKS